MIQLLVIASLVSTTFYNRLNCWCTIEEGLKRNLTLFPIPPLMHVPPLPPPYLCDTNTNHIKCWVCKLLQYIILLVWYWMWNNDMMLIVFDVLHGGYCNCIWKNEDPDCLWMSPLTMMTNLGSITELQGPGLYLYDNILLVSSLILNITLH